MNAHDTDPGLPDDAPMKKGTSFMYSIIQFILCSIRRWQRPGNRAETPSQNHPGPATGSI